MSNVVVRFIEIYKWRIVISLALLAFSLVLVFEPGFWVFDALDSVRIPYAIFLTLFTMFFFIRGNKMLSGSAAIALLFLVPGLWPYFKTSSDTPLEKKIKNESFETSDFSVLHFNVKENNKNILSVAYSAIESNADIISFQELHETSLDKIDTVMKKKYPYELSDVTIPGFGMAVYSKYPIHERSVMKEKNFPVLSGMVEVNGKYVHFISATTNTPTNQKDFDTQKKQFKVIADYANQIDSPLVVMGDMNAVPWSENIQQLLKETQLKDSRKDLSATFPANSIFQIPIDYIFHSAEVNCNRFSTIGGTSSNHLGIIGYYSFKARNKKE